MSANLSDTAGVPHTEGIKYTGSKLRLLPYIIDEIKRLGVKDILDGFSGTTKVSQALSRMGYDVTANDISEWSEVFGHCYLLSSKTGFLLPAVHRRTQFARGV